MCRCRTLLLSFNRIGISSTFRGAHFLLPTMTCCSSSSTSAEEPQTQILCPPIEVRGMLELDRSKFSKTIQIPCVRVPAKSIGRLVGLPAVRQFSLPKMPRLKPVTNADDSEGGEKLLLLDPDKFAAADPAQRRTLAESIGKQIGGEVKRVEEEKAAEDNQEVVKAEAANAESRKMLISFERISRRMDYEDWDQRRCIRAVLPPGMEFSGFEQCGHIAHVNLREPLLPFRFVIGQILLDKTARTRTVINKLDQLSNEFRVMDAELLAGEADFLAEVQEDGIRYKLDYSKVFWNSRLSTVHRETVELFDRHSLVFDVFTGVGPFVLPAVRKRGVRKAFANDLNPAAIDFLCQSMELNKIPDDRVQTFVLDGAQFIREMIPQRICAHLLDQHREISDQSTAAGEATTSQGGIIELVVAADSLPPNFHVVMNLPCQSADHLPLFRGFLSKFPQIRAQFERCHLWIHCHFFVKASDDLPMEWYRAEATRIVREKLAAPDLEIQELNFNRKVASRKNMFCARIRLPAEIAFGEEAAMQTEVEHGQRRENGAAENALEDHNSSGETPGRKAVGEDEEEDKKEEEMLMAMKRRKIVH